MLGRRIISEGKYLSALATFINKVKLPNSRNLSTSLERIFEVSPSCNLHIELPCDISIRPLDFVKYPSYDRVLVNFFRNDDSSEEPVQFEENPQSLKIFSTSDNGSISRCNIEAPAITDVQAISKCGNIEISDFKNGNIVLETLSGGISASKCLSDKISIISSSGDIVLTDVIQASEIFLKTGKSASITAGRLQGNVLIATTESGKIATKSSYCLQSTFSTKYGTLDLQNVHKDCNVYIGSGKLNMGCFDGMLNVSIDEGDATVQITRLVGSSKISIIKNGTLVLKLTEDCLQDTQFKIDSKVLNACDGVNLLQDQSIHNCNKNNLIVVCKNSVVNIHKASFMEMLNLKSVNK